MGADAKKLHLFSDLGATEYNKCAPRVQHVRISLKPAQVEPHFPCEHKLRHVFMCRDDVHCLVRPCQTPKCAPFAECTDACQSPTNPVLFTMCRRYTQQGSTRRTFRVFSDEQPFKNFDLRNMTSEFRLLPVVITITVCGASGNSRKFRLAESSPTMQG